MPVGHWCAVKRRRCKGIEDAAAVLADSIMCALVRDNCRLLAHLLWVWQGKRQSLLKSIDTVQLDCDLLKEAAAMPLQSLELL